MQGIISKDLKSSGTMPECCSRVRPARLRGRERGKERGFSLHVLQGIESTIKFVLAYVTSSSVHVQNSMNCQDALQ